MSRRGTHLSVGLAALVILLLISGCGGSGEAKVSGSVPRVATRTVPVARPRVDPRLIASADAICRRYNRQLISASSSESSDVARNAPRNAAIELRAVAALSKLTPPVSSVHDWTQILAYRRSLARELIALARDAAAGDVAGMRALGASKKSVRQKLTQLAARDGFKDCTSVGTVSVGTLFSTGAPKS